MAYIKYLTEEIIEDDPIFYRNDINYQIYQQIIKNLTLKYGESPAPLIESRIRDEWSWSQLTESYYTLAVLSDLIHNLLDFAIPYSPRNSCNSSFMLYLLGLTRINPLPPHYHCPCCHSIVWTNDAKCGMDLKNDMRCKNDGTIMETNGFDIPWQPSYMNNDGNNIFIISLRLKDYCSVIDILDYMGIPYDIYSRHCYNKEIQVIETTNIILQFNLPNKINNTFLSKPYQNTFDNISIINKAYQYAKKTSPALNVSINSIADIISYMGIMRSNFATENKLKALINVLGYQPSTLITCRQDLFQYYLDYEINENLAFTFMNNVRKGKQDLSNFPVNEMHSARDKWVVSLCNDIRYLPDKTEIVEDLLFNLSYRPDNIPFEHLLD